jgi:Arc/MetJ-type ribon-helix-helix transcriptional regulator
MWLRRLGLVSAVATLKITVTLEREQVNEIRALVAAGVMPNVSALAKHGVQVALADAAGWKQMLDEAPEQTGGPLTAKERAWADEVLSPTAGPKKGSRRGKAV